MTHKAIIGLDAAQDGVCFHLTTGSGGPLHAGRATKSTTGWKELKQALAAHDLAPKDCLAAIEATGDHHLPWCEAWTAEGGTILALNPLVAKRTTPVRNAIRDHKADPIDAEGLAQTAAREAEALLRFTYRSEPAVLGLRKLLAAQAAVRTALTNLKKHTGALQELCFPELKGTGLSPRRQSQLLQTAATPAQVAGLAQAKLRELAGDHAPAVLAAAQNSFAPAVLAAATVPALQAMLRTVADLEGSLRAIDHAVDQQAARAIPAERLALAQSLPGFGVKTTPIVLACVPDEVWRRTQRRKKKVACIQALFGMDPRVRESGRWKGKIKLSKRGIRAARTAMFQIAFCSVIHDPAMRAYYQHLTKVLKKKPKVALFDLARKHLRRLVAVLESGHPHQPTNLPTAA
jgi:transposase